MKRFNEKNILDVDPNPSVSDMKAGLAIPAGNGKGDGQRPSQISKDTLARNWCRTFGHKGLNFDTRKCRDCGMTVAEITDEAFPASFQQ